MAVLGDMRELGQATERYHREIGEYAATSGGLDLLVCIGPKSDLIAESAVAAGLDATSVLRFPDAPAAALAVPRVLQAGDLVLLKASRHAAGDAGGGDRTFFQRDQPASVSRRCESDKS